MDCEKNRESWKKKELIVKTLFEEKKIIRLYYKDINILKRYYDNNKR